MITRFGFLLSLISCLFCADYDCIVIGSSPFSMLEALYQNHLGKTVLILEEASKCGGAWKTIEICGVTHAELGCHSIPSGNDLVLKSFLEEYVGCKIVSIDNPSAPFEVGKCPNGWYFSRGCFELVENLLNLIQATNIEIRLNSKVERLSMLLPEKLALVHTQNRSITTDKLILTPMSTIQIDSTTAPQSSQKSKHYHLYMLIDDPNPPTFSYRGGVAQGISRMMNMTHFVGLTGSGKQLIALQTYDEKTLLNEKQYLDAMKAHNLIAPSACILQTETYIYETGYFNQNIINQIGAFGVIEVLQTGVLPSMSNYIPKWKMVLKPYREAIQASVKNQI